MVWYGMTWGDIISYEVVWYGLCKGEHMGVHWDMDWQMKDAVISKKDEDWTCRESVSNSRGCFNGWNEQVETCWNRQLEGLSNKHLTKILLRNPHPQACLVGALESISPDPETSSDFWNHRKLLLHQWHQVTSSDIRGLLFTLLAAESQKEVPKDEVNDQNQNTQGWKDLSLGNWQQFGVGFLKK